jgi:hypothetical protein
VLGCYQGQGQCAILTSLALLTCGAPISGPLKIEVGSWLGRKMQNGAAPSRLVESWPVGRSHRTQDGSKMPGLFIRNPYNARL